MVGLRDIAQCMCFDISLHCMAYMVDTLSKKKKKMDTAILGEISKPQQKINDILTFDTIKDWLLNLPVVAEFMKDATMDCSPNL